MKGIVDRKGKNKIGVFVIVKDEDNNTYYGNNNNIQQELLDQLTKGMKVEFEHIISRTGNPTITSLEIINQTIEENTLCLMVQGIQEIIDQKGFFLCSDFPEFMRSFGIDNFRDYAASSEEFVSKYFSDHLRFEDKIISKGRTYPNVIVPKDYVIDTDSDTNQNADHSSASVDISNKEWSELDELYNDGKWVEYIQNPLFSQSDPSSLPLLYLERGISCAAKLLCGRDTEDYKLTLIQKELITSRTAKDFIKKWKKASVFGDIILGSYIESSMCDFSSPKDNGLIVKIFNSLGADTKPNNTITGLISRFEICKDGIVPFLYVIRLLNSKSAKSAEQCISEYCYFIKNLNTFNIQIVQKRVRFENQIEYFTSFLELAKINGVAFARNLRTNVISVFFDVRRASELSRVISIVDEEENSPERALVKLMNSDMWEERQIQVLFEANISLQLVEKAIAVLWDNYADQDYLPEQFMSVLAWTLKHGDCKVLDEIVKLHYTSGYTKKEKQRALFNSVKRVMNCLELDDSYYNLITYVFEYILPEITSDIDTDIDTLRSEWQEVSNSYYESRLNKLLPISTDTVDEMMALFPVFSMDEKKNSELQNIYGEWYLQSHNWDEYSNEQIQSLLLKAISDGCYRAFQLIYEDKLINHEDIDNLHEIYLDTLVLSGEYRKAIQFAYGCQYINAECREKYIVRAVCGNFAKCGFSQSGLMIFDDDFSVKDAIEILSRNFVANDYALILALVVLFSHNNELIKSVYLFSIYRTHAESGFSRSYAQFRTKYGRYFNKVRNHYDVIEIAFNCLPMQTLLHFLKWASQIVIPDYSDSVAANHPFSVFYDNLLKEPENENVWKAALGHMIGSDQKREMNAWLIAVCGLTMVRKFGMPQNSFIRNAFVRVMEEDYPDKPKNFLYYISQYIVDTQDCSLCVQLCELLTNKASRSQLLTNNPWCQHDDKTINSFVSFCVEKLKETGDTIYFDIITNIKEDMSGKELIELSSYSANKSLLIRKICQCYLDAANEDEAKSLLKIDLWSGASFKEREIYRILKLAYEKDYVLINSFPKIFDNEEEVQRFKQDCVKIIASNSNIETLLSFDRECNDIKHKLLVFAFTFGVCYSESIYKKYWFDYHEMVELDLVEVFLLYLKKCFIAQLIHNTAYIFEYKIWRYYKLLMLELLEKDTNENSETESLMKQNGHYDRMVSCGYVNFKNQLSSFITSANVSDSEKKELIYCLISADFSSLYDLENSLLLKLDAQSIESLKQILSSLNYRDVNEKFYNHYIPIFTESNAQQIVLLAKTMSDSVAIAFNEWRSIYKKDSTSNLFAEIALQSGTSNKSSSNSCVEKVMLLDDKTYLKHCTFINAILASKQFPGKIFDHLRMVCIGRAKGSFNQRFESLAIFLQNNGYSSAISQYRYLVALQMAYKKDKSALCSYLDEFGTDFLDEVPEQWRPDSHKIIEYSQSQKSDVVFVPDSSFFYSESYVIEINEAPTFSFVKFLCDEYCLKSGDEDADCDADFESKEEDEETKIVRDLKKFNSIGIKKDNIQQVIELGLSITSKETSKFLTKHKLVVLIDLYRNRGELTRIQIETIFDHFLEIYRDFSLDVWLEYQIDILNILSINASQQDINEVEDLCKQITEKCPVFSLPISERATEAVYEQLSHIVFIGQSPYVSAIKAIVTKRKTKIESEARLAISIENEDNKIQDKTVYFQLNNIGHITVNLNDNCEIYMRVILDDGRPVDYSISVSDISELRPGWITGCKQSIEEELFKDLEIGDGFDIEIKVIVNDKLIVSTSAKLTISEVAILNPYDLGDTYYVDAAVGDSTHKLYGRKAEQRKIIRGLKKGKVVIYGPSRIGKTSLLNWVRTDLAASRENVITLLFGGEQGKGKDSDYNEYFYDSSRKLCYNGEDIEHIERVNRDISEYLLIDTLKYALVSAGANKFRRASFGSRVSKKSELFDRMRGILDQSDTIDIKYGLIDDLLKEFDTQLWILFDEFQQVVEQWKCITESSDFIDVYKIIGDSSNIKLIFCGSDELLSEMVLTKDNSVWKNKVLKPAGQVRVGPMEEPSLNGEPDAFIEMIEKDEAVTIPGLRYSKDALSAICVYSDRVPLYAKLICNAVLEVFAKNTDRNVIYTYDISRATQKLLDLYNDNVDTQTGRSEFNTATIVDIIEAVIKGLKDDSDKQYLWYMANWFKANSTMEVFPFSAFESFTDAETGVQYTMREDAANNLRDSLIVARERGIIRGDENVGFAFSTVFYHNAFGGMSSHKFDRDKIFVRNEDVSQQTPDDDYSDKFKLFVDQMTLDEKKDNCTLLYRWISSEDKRFPEEFRNQFGGTNNFAGPVEVVYGDKVQISAQTINNSINTLLSAPISAESMLSALSGLPSVRAYLESSPGQLALLDEKIGVIQEFDQKINAVDQTIEQTLALLGDDGDQSVVLALEGKKADMIAQRDTVCAEVEAASSVAEEKMLSDTMSVVSFEDLLAVTPERKRKLWHLDSNYDLSKFDTLGEYQAPLAFAFTLHNIFDRMYSRDITEDDKKNMTQEEVEKIQKEREKMDFCPVAIMYCKIVEAMLKDKHTPIYKMCFENRPINDKKTNSPLFKDVDSSHPDLTIGTYLWFVSSFNVKTIDNKAGYIRRNPIRFSKDAEIDLLAHCSSCAPSVWKEHACDLPVIAATRNKSAHELQPINKERFDWLIEILFKRGELLRIMELTNGHNN